MTRITRARAALSIPALLVGAAFVLLLTSAPAHAATRVGRPIVVSTGKGAGRPAVVPVTTPPIVYPSPTHSPPTSPPPTKPPPTTPPPTTPPPTTPPPTTPAPPPTSAHPKPTSSVVTNPTQATSHPGHHASAPNYGPGSDSSGAATPSQPGLSAAPASPTVLTTADSPGPSLASPSLLTQQPTSGPPVAVRPIDLAGSPATALGLSDNIILASTVGVFALLVVILVSAGGYRGNWRRH